MPSHLNKPPLWIPSEEEIKTTHIYKHMKKNGFQNYNDYFKWTVSNRENFWKETIDTLNIQFKKKYTKILELKEHEEQWLEKARLNIVDSCFLANPKSKAILFEREDGFKKEISYGDLEKLTNQVSNSLIKVGFKEKDPISLADTLEHVMGMSELERKALGAALRTIAVEKYSLVALIGRIVEKLA